MPSVSQENNRSKKNSWKQSRWLPLCSVLLALILLAGAIVAGTLHLRSRLQAQAIERQGEILKAVSVMQYLSSQELDPRISLADTTPQFDIMMHAAFLEGVMGIRLFDAKGNFVTSFPEYVKERNLSRTELHQVGEKDSYSQYFGAIDLSEEFLADPRRQDATKPVPIMEVTISFREHENEPLLGVGQLIIDGKSMAQEFATMNRTLTMQASLLFIVCGTLMTVTLSWAFARLARANAELAERSESLLKANQELALMARTSAVGAVAANLMHGLKSPLFGLISLFGAWRASENVGEKVEWSTAVETARRMQAMVNGVMDFVRDQEGLSNHEVTIEELLESIDSKVAPIAEQSQVKFALNGEADAVLSARVANLLTLILVNLVQNAIEATPSGKQVKLCVRQEAKEIEFDVIDEGNGLRPELEHQLFRPCESSKEGGSGLGLAICKQLARHIGADLKLRRNTANGCVFGLTLPPELLPQESSAA